MTRGRPLGVAVGAILLLLLGAHAGSLPASAQAPTGSAPTVTLSVPTTYKADCTCLRGTVQVSAAASATAGRDVASVVFEASAAGADTWQSIAVRTRPPFAFAWDTESVGAPGPYDVRAIVTDSAGERTVSAVARDRVLANNATAVSLADPGGTLRATIELKTTTEPGGNGPTNVTFERSPAGAERWTTIAADVEPATDENGDLILVGGYETFTAKLDTRALPDGPIDLRVIATDGVPEDLFVSGPRRDRLVDNTAPEASLNAPSGALRGLATLTASAQDAGAGVAAVRFERSAPGADRWTSIGADASAPFEQGFDTRLLDDGVYDFRAFVTDKAGNVAASPTVRDVAVANPVRVRFDQLEIENMVAPARDISLLGSIAGSSQGETWAYGFTNAPAATAEGERLPYVAQGQGQLVLLRYTDAGGWQIADVLRKADGSAFDQVPRTSPASPFAVTGQMAPSGEAWIAVSQQRAGQPAREVGVFRRAPRGRFLLDAAATSSLTPLLNGPGGLAQGVLTLKEGPGGSVHGLLRAPGQRQRSVFVPNSSGTTTRINEQLDFGSLVDGGWTVTRAARPADYQPFPSERLLLSALEPTRPGAGWGVVSRTGATRRPLQLARFANSNWEFVPTGLDALDLTGAFAAASAPSVNSPTILRDDADGVWVGVESVGPSVGPARVVGRYDTAARQVTKSWCSPGLSGRSLGCGVPLNPGQVGVPDRVFETPDGKVALSLQPNFLDVYAYGDWSSVAAPGFAPGPGKALFTAPDEGWLVGDNAMGRVRAKLPPPPLEVWPQANRSPLTSVALPAASRAGVADPGALAVGLDGTALRYEPGAGWLVEPTPSRARRIGLRGVAFSGPRAAVAVGQLGTILRWDGVAWSEDPQSVTVTQSQLNAVAFNQDGEGWAVGALGTILHFDGRSWTPEAPPAGDEGVSIGSVSVAGREVFAVAGGNLITRGDSGTWSRVDRSQLPSPVPAAGALRLVAGLPDGGVVAAGRSLVMVRQGGSEPFEYSSQPLEGIAVALAAFRDQGGRVRAFVSLGPSVADDGGNDTRDVGPFPSGDGSLLRQTADGWQDLSRSQYAGAAASGDGAVKADPVLAVAVAPGGDAAWAVGGYAGTRAAARLGTDAPLPARPAGWRTSAIWRYDTGTSVPSPALATAEVRLPAQPNTVTFAFFSGAMCKSQCGVVRDAQPDVNVAAAARQIALFGAEPGGPSFAVLGGNARGPIEDGAYDAGNGAFDFARIDGLLAPLGKLPLYAAYGPRDAVPNRDDPTEPWAEAFAQAPAPFGRGAAPASITPNGSGAPSGPVKRYYAFDASQNGGLLRVVVIDNANGSLEASAPGQAAWLDRQLRGALVDGLPVVVVAGRPLRSSVSGDPSDDALANRLADAGVLAVFTASSAGRTQLNRRVLVPEGTDRSTPQIPEYEGATLGYQQTQNNGVLWYSVSVDTTARTVDVKAIPIVDSLAIKPLAGLAAARSSTLQFEAVGRRPAGSLATTPGDDTFPGIDSYVSIPATCSGCVAPSYAFTSSDPTIGDFVVPSGPGSRFPRLDASGRPTPSPTSGLFCAFNAGTTTISVTSGLLASSLPVQVRAGDIGRPCGTVFREGVGRTVFVPSTRQLGRAPAPGGEATPPPPPPPAATPTPNTELPAVAPPLPPAPVPAPPDPPAPAPEARTAKPTPPTPAQPPAPLAPILEAPQVPSTLNVVPPAPVIAVPPIPPVSTPIPPGGSASAQAAARRKEKAVKQASQSAFSARPSGASAEDFFYPVLGVASLLALLLTAGGMRAGPTPRPALLLLRDDQRRQRRHERWTP